MVIPIPITIPVSGSYVAHTASWLEDVLIWYSLIGLLGGTMLYVDYLTEFHSSKRIIPAKILVVIILCGPLSAAVCFLIWAWIRVANWAIPASKQGNKPELVRRG